MTEGADQLWYARAVLADIAAHDDAVVIEACRLVEASTTDSTEQADTAQLRERLEGATPLSAASHNDVPAGGHSPSGVTS